MTTEELHKMNVSRHAMIFAMWYGAKDRAEETIDRAEEAIDRAEAELDLLEKQAVVLEEVMKRDGVTLEDVQGALFMKELGLVSGAPEQRS